MKQLAAVLGSRITGAGGNDTQNREMSNGAQRQRIDGSRRHSAAELTEVNPLLHLLPHFVFQGADVFSHVHE